MQEEILAHYKIIKSNKLVQSKSAFSAIEHRIILLAMAQIQPKDSNLTMYRINIHNVLGTCHTSNYDVVRRAVEKLHKSIIRIEEDKKWKSYAFITKAQGEYGKNYIEIQFHDDIQNFLLGLKSKYTTYTLNNVIKFKKNYSLRIYELCKQYEKIGMREMSIKYLKNILSLEKRYHTLSPFKKYVLHASIEEINTYSDLFLRYEDIKIGRKVEKIRFLIDRNRDVVVPEISIFSQSKDYVTSVVLNRKNHSTEKWKKMVINKQRLITDLKEKIAQDRYDIREYQSTGKLREGDHILRFKDKTVSEAIEELVDRLDTNTYVLQKRENELKKILHKQEIL